MKNILVVTDGSETSNKALLETKKLAEINNSKVTILHAVNNIVTHPSLLGQGYSIKTNEGLIKLGEELLNEARDLFEGFAGKVEIKQKIGDAGKEIIAESKIGDYDLLVIGNRGLGAFSRVLLGSVSNKVINHVKINVLVVK